MSTPKKIDANKYIGIPFVEGGRSFDGCDCYGLLMLFFKHELEIELPEVNILPGQHRLSMLRFIQEVEKNWDKLEDKELHCAVALRSHPENRRLVTHYGLIVKANGKLQLLHTFEGTKSTLVKLNNPGFANIIEGFYRWRH